MTIFHFLVVPAVIFGVTVSQEANIYGTIFDDEKLEGGPLQNNDYFKEASLRDNVNAYRLPTTTKPEHYDLFWSINFTGFSFSGEVDIYLHATQENVNEISLHAHDLNIISLELYQQNKIVYQTYTQQSEYHFLRVRLMNETLEYNAAVPIIYRLSIGFEAPMRTDMTGLYRSWFKNNNTNSESWIATTFFAPTGARLAFPCYDEPSFKATFEITIRRPSGYNSWSCTRKQRTMDSSYDNFQDDVYFKTPKMSTYLIAFVVAEYESIKSEENGLLLHEVIARADAINKKQAEYAQEVGIKLVEAMSRYTGIDFYSVHPDIKMSHVAIPDFSAGAMENWGLVAYREAYLLYDKKHTNSHYKQMIAYLVSHEITHMWFGNLVTCDWWGVVWLNEGFARYYQYYLTDMVEDYMKFPTRFVTEQVHTSLLSDSADNPHPLSNPDVGSPESASEMFSTITYNKGASVIRMTEHLLGSEVHKEGIRRYLKSRLLDNASPIHLFQILEEVAEEYDAISMYGPDFNVIDYYKTWTEQGGHPVIKVEVDHSTGLMTIHQRRFNINTGFSTATTNWIIPINFATASSPNFNETKPSHIIRDSVTIIDRRTTGDQWVIFNKQQTGFYRVHYDDYSWNLIIMALRTSDKNVIHQFNRAQIVDDVFQFARSGIMSYTKAFNILSYLIDEYDSAPWAAAIAGFNWISNRFAGTSLEPRLNELFIKWANGVMNNLTYDPIDGELFSRTYLRYQLAPVICRFGHQNCRNLAMLQFEELRTEGIEVTPDNRNWVYCNGLRDGTVDDFNFLWKRYINHDVNNEKILLLTVLGCTPHAAALNRFLDAIVQDNFIVRPQDYTTAFNSAVTGNQNNTQIVFQYIKNNLQVVIDAFGTATTPLSYISSRLLTVREVEEFREWAVSEQAVLGASFQAVYNGAQASLNALEWASKVEGDISNYLDNGDEIFMTSTTAATETTVEETITQNPLIEPTTPNLQGSANI